MDITDPGLSATLNTAKFSAFYVRSALPRREAPFGPLAWRFGACSSPIAGPLRANGSLGGIPRPAAPPNGAKYTSRGCTRCGWFGYEHVLQPRCAHSRSILRVPPNLGICHENHSINDPITAARSRAPRPGGASTSAMTGWVPLVRDMGAETDARTDSVRN